MFNMGGGELFLIALVALLVIKPDKLPGLATSIGRWFGELTRSLNEVKNAVAKDYTTSLKNSSQTPSAESKSTQPETESQKPSKDNQHAAS